VPKYPPNRLPLSVPKNYFELRRGGLKGAAAARRVGVSTSAGSLWFIKAGRMLLPDKPIDDRYLTQDDRIVIAEGLLAGRTAAQIADQISKHRSTVYREISRGRGADGRYNPWWSHNQAILRRARPKEEKIRASRALRDVINDKLKQRWSPQQITRHLARTSPGRPNLNACPETIYRALYNGLVDKRTARLRTRRTRRKKQRRGTPTKNAIPNMRSQRQHHLVQRTRPAGVLGQQPRAEGAQTVPGDLHGYRADLRHDFLGPVAVAHVAARARTTAAGPPCLGREVHIHLGLQSGLHQMLGQLGQQPALAHQPQPSQAHLLGRQRGQLLQQLAGQTVHGYRHRLHVGTLDALTGHGKRHTVSGLDQVIRRRTHQVTPSGKHTPDS
jgi:hypothetical protein